MLYLYKPTDAVTMVRGGARNLCDGTRSSSLEHFVQTVDSILQGENGFDSIAEMVALVYKDSSKSLVLYNESHFLLHHPTERDIDAIIINKESVHFYNSNRGGYAAEFTYGHAATALAGLDVATPKAFVDSITKLTRLTSGYESKMTGGVAQETLFFVLDNKTGSIILGTEADDEQYFNHVFDGKYLSSSVIPKAVPEVKTESKPNMEEKTMSKVNAIVTANKTAAQTAVKIEAGNIALDKLAKLLAPRMPFGTSSYLKSPLGKVVMANLISFAITQYAANNPKAKIIGDAVMDAAALELVQSFNISALIDDLVGSINLTGLEEPTGLDKYAVKAE